MVEQPAGDGPQSAGLCSARQLAFFGYDPGTPADGSLTFNSFATSTGQFTITPNSGFAGVSKVLVGVETASDNTNNTPNFDSQ